MDYYDIFSLQSIVWEIDKAIICGKTRKVTRYKKNCMRIIYQLR